MTSIIRFIGSGISAALLFVGLLTPAAAQPGMVLDPEPELSSTFKEPAPWQESDLELPDWPRDKDLIEIAIDDPNPRFRFFIDSRSLKTGDDDVVRFTLIAETPTGVRNIDFRGLRCKAHGRFRIYAYGIDGRFTPTGLPDDWISIRDPATDRVQRDLWRYYLCDTQIFKPLKRRQQLHLLRQGVSSDTRGGLLLD